MLNPDYRDMLSALSDEGVEFLLVGAFALAAHGVPRATGDIDIWVRATEDNARRVWRALAQFGAPTHDLTTADLATPDIVFQIGVAPRRIDILTAIDGVTFDEAWRRRVTIELDGVVVPVIGREDLIRNKRASGRPKDVADLDWLDRASS
jgi:predicted nucleotidyltransferase